MDRSQSYNRGDSNRYNPTSRASAFSGEEERWTRVGQGPSERDSRVGGRAADERGQGYQRHEQRRQQNGYQPQQRRQHDAPASSGSQWVARGKPDSDLMGEAFGGLELMGEAFGGLDPGEEEPGGPESANVEGPGDDLWLDAGAPTGDGATRASAPPTTSLTLAQLEEAVLGGDIRGWSLERLAEAVTAVSGEWGAWRAAWR
jgi:hypothetical protein